jgi:hypothetical protein
MIGSPKFEPNDADAPRREEVRKKQTFELIGAFFFRFSQLEFTIRVFLAARLNLTDEQFDVVTSPYDFRMLCAVTEAISIQQFPSEKNNIEKYFKRCLALNDDRVRIAHGLWTDSGRGLAARHVARTSLKPEFYFEDPNELIKLIKTAERLMPQLLFFASVPTSKEDGDKASHSSS